MLGEATAAELFAVQGFDRPCERTLHPKDPDGHNHPAERCSRPLPIAVCQPLSTPLGAYRKLDMDVFARSGKVEARHTVHFGALEIVHGDFAENDLAQLSRL